MLPSCSSYPCCRWLPGVSGACEATIRVLLANANCDPVADRAHEQVVVKLERETVKVDDGNGGNGGAPPQQTQQQRTPDSANYGGSDTQFAGGCGDYGGFGSPSHGAQGGTQGGGAPLQSSGDTVERRQIELPDFKSADRAEANCGERPHKLELQHLCNSAFEMQPSKIAARYEFMRDSAQMRTLLRMRGVESDVRDVRTVFKEVTTLLRPEVLQAKQRLDDAWRGRKEEAENNFEEFDEAPPTTLNAIASVVALVMPTPCELALMSGSTMRYYDYAYHCSHPRGESSGGLRAKLHKLKMPERLDMQDNFSNFQLQLANMITGSGADTSVLRSCFERVSKDLTRWQQSVQPLEMCTPEMLRDVCWLMTNKDHDRAVRWRLPLTTPPQPSDNAPSPATCRTEDVFVQASPSRHGGVRWKMALPPLREVSPTPQQLEVPDNARDQPPPNRRLSPFYGPRNGLHHDSGEINATRSRANAELLPDEVARGVAAVWMDLGYAGKTEEVGDNPPEEELYRVTEEAFEEASEFARLCNLRYVQETVSVGTAYSVSTAPFDFEDGLLTINQAWFIEMANLLQRAMLRLSLQPGMVSKIEFKPYLLNIARRSEPAAFRLLPAFGHATACVNVHRPTWTWWSTRSQARRRITATRTRRAASGSTWCRGTRAPTAASSTSSDCACWTR